jgi:predicted GTPase
MAYLPVSSVTEPIKCNILLIGKTGAGKSSFANYLFDTERFTTGSGAPVTGWKENFQYYHFTISNISVNVYDSVGLEPNNFDRWTSELDDFLSERQSNDCGRVNSANSIIHTVFYVVNGAGARIEGTELRVLKNTSEKYALPSSIIITNCDIAKESEVSAIEREAEKIGLNSFRVCSISKKTRGGDKVESFGKELAIQQILSASYEKVGKELASGVLQEVIDALDQFKRRAKAKIDDSDISIFNLEAMDNIDLDDISPGFFDLPDLIPPEYKNYQEFLEGFDVNYHGRDIMNETMDSLSDAISSISVNDIKLAQKGKKLMDDLEHGGFFSKVGAFFEFAGMVVFIKDTLKQGIDEMFDLAISKIRQQLWKVENHDI